MDWDTGKAIKIRKPVGERLKGMGFRGNFPAEMGVCVRKKRVYFPGGVVLENTTDRGT